MMKNRFKGILAIMLTAAVVQAQSPGIIEKTHPLGIRIDALFEAWDKPTSPGCAVAVIKDAEILYERGYGMADLEHDVPVTPKTVFYIGSTSKQFVTFCILLLEEEGKLNLDDDIRVHIPEFPEYDRPITIRHLIHHTSGIRDYLTLWSLKGYSYLDHIPEEAVLDLIYRQEELNFSPGDRYLYSNSCYFLLAVIVERASGQTLRQYADANIFGPLGMTNSHFHDDVNTIIKNRAFGYSRKTDGGFNNLIMRFDLVGSGGLYTNVEDLARWDQNFYENRLGRKNPGLIDRMHSNGRLNSGEALDYAFALRNGTYRGLRTVDHGGALGGYRAQLLRFPDQRFSVIILSNLADFNPGEKAYQIADIVLSDLLEPEPTEGVTADPIHRKEIELDSSVFEKYVGRYRVRPGFILAITMEDDKFMVQATGQSIFRIFPESETEFFLSDSDARISFKPDHRGDVDRLILHQNGRDMPAVRIKSIHLTEDQIREYAGVYTSKELDVSYRVFSQDRGLFVKVGYNPELEMKPIKRDEFETSEIRMMFNRDSQDTITGFRVDAGRVQNLKFIKQPDLK